MSNNVVPGTQHVQGRSNPAELRFQAIDGSQDFVRDDAFTFDLHEQTVPEPLAFAQNHEMFSNYNPFSSFGTIGGSPIETGHLWDTSGIPNSLPTSLPPSIGSDTYDASTSEFQTTDQRMLDSLPFLVGGQTQTSYFNKSVWNPDYSSMVPQVPQINNDMTSITTRPLQPVVDPRAPIMSRKRKRPTVESTDEDDDAKPSSRRTVKYLFRWLKHPKVPDLEKIAKDNHRSFKFVVECFLEQIDQSKFNSDFCDAIASNGQSTCWQEERERSIGDISQNDEAENLSLTGVRIRQKRFAKKPDFDARKAIVDSDKAETHRCSECGTSCRRKSDLKRHMNKHKPEEMHCQYQGCRWAFYRIDKLKDHWKRCHQDSSKTIMPKKHRQRDDETDEDPDFGGPHNHSDQPGSSERNKPPTVPRKGSSSVRSRCAGQEQLSDINYGLASRAETPYFISNNKSLINDKTDIESAKIIKKLGRGGFGSVYEVSVTCGPDIKSQRNFACKIIPIPRKHCREVIDRAQNEISILQVLDHPGIIKLAGAFMLNEHIFIHTFPVADCNLNEFLKNQSFPLSNQFKRQLWEGVRNLAFALAYIHEYGMGGGIHGDIKPENILIIHDIEDGSRTKFFLADFGSARLRPTASMEDLRKQALTPKYCAPELFKDKGERGPPSDMWSLGCILMQIVTYIHDKTMIDFEAFRASISELKSNWTYYEILPIVNKWLCLLSLRCADFKRPTAWKKQIDTIAEMLLPNPKERPSAVGLISKMDAESCETLFDGNAVSSKLSTSMLRGAQCAPTERGKVADSLSASPESSRLHSSQGCPSYESTRIMHMDKDSNEWHTSLPKQLLPEAFKAKLILNDTDERLAKNSSRSAELFTKQLSSLCLIPEPSFALTKVPQTDSSANVHPQIVPNYAISSGLIEKDSREPGEVTQSESLIRLSNVKKGSKVKLLPGGGKNSSPSIPASLPQAPGMPRKFQQQRSIRPCPSGQILNSTPQIPVKRGSRCGPLSFETKKHAQAMRYQRACIRCRLLKVACSSDPVCTRCVKNTNLEVTTCYRPDFRQYIACFFPPLLLSHLNESAIKCMIEKVTFVGETIEVQVSSGLAYPTMSVIVQEFKSSCLDIFTSSHLDGRSVNDNVKVSLAYDPPIAVFEDGKRQLSIICRKYIDSITNQSQDSLECIFHDASKITWGALKMINSYRQSSSTLRDGLLRKAEMLYWTLHFLCHPMTFTPESSEKVTWLLEPSLALNKVPTPTITAKVLDIQLKRAMYLIFTEMTEQVLVELEHALPPRRSRSSWPIAFSVYLILCICTEEIQIAIDNLVTWKLCEDPEKAHSRDEHCHTLENELYKPLVDIFHLAYATKRANGKYKNGINPIRDGLSTNEVEGINEAEVNLVNEIQCLMKVYEKEIDERAVDLVFDNRPDLPSHHKAFRERNSGRLVSKFLRSFLE